MDGSPADTLDTPARLPYNTKVINGTPMNTETFVEGVVIDLCSRSFLLLSDQGDEKFVECDTTEQFMNVLEVCTSHLNDDQIEYADLAVQGEQY